MFCLCAGGSNVHSRSVSLSVIKRIARSTPSQIVPVVPLTRRTTVPEYSQPAELPDNAHTYATTHRSQLGGFDKVNELITTRMREWLAATGTAALDTLRRTKGDAHANASALMSNLSVLLETVS